MLSRRSGATPGPSSATTIVQRSSSTVMVTSTALPAGAYASALSTRFVRICETSSAPATFAVATPPFTTIRTFGALRLDDERLADLFDDGAELLLLVDVRAADGVAREVAGDACALLDDGERVRHGLGRRAGRASLTDPAEQDRERVRHVVEDAREIAVGIGRLRHGRERYDNSRSTSPSPRHGSSRFGIDAATAYLHAASSSRRRPPATTPSAVSRASVSCEDAAMILVVGVEARTEVLADAAQEHAREDGLRDVLAGALAFLAKRAELASGIAQRHAVLREERARRLAPRIRRGRAEPRAMPVMRSA